MGVLIRRKTALVMLGLAVAVLAAAGGVARADDDYPNHAVRWLVGYPPGGSTDICALDRAIFVRAFAPAIRRGEQARRRQ